MNTYTLWRALYSILMFITHHLIPVRNSIFILHEELPIVVYYNVHIVIIIILVRTGPDMNLGGGGYCLEVVFEVQSDELMIVDWTAVSEGVK